MKNIFKAASILGLLLFISCSEDEKGRDLGQNGFMNDETFYVLNSAFVNDQNTANQLPSPISVTLSNVNLADSSAVSNIARLYFKFNGVALAPGTVATISDYYLQIQGSFQPVAGTANFTYVNGTYLLNSAQPQLEAAQKTVTINSVAANRVDLTFEFTRNDGKVFSGKYSGTFSDAVVAP
ncbi:MAG TPA: hypothetical protein VFR70_11140 [Flavobacterium sp.]|nr:hypothetical protein [Flavobacterium sp.]